MRCQNAFVAENFYQTSSYFLITFRTKTPFIHRIQILIFYTIFLEPNKHRKMIFIYMNL